MNYFEELDIRYSLNRYDRKLGSHFNLQTSVDRRFTELRELWYPQGKKIVPPIDLTPKTFAFHFMGDGSSYTYYKNTNKVIAIFTTQGFDYNSVMYIVEGLEEKGIHCKVYPKGKGYNISIKESKSVKRLFDMIEPYMLECFKYKIKNTSVGTKTKPLRKWRVEGTRDGCQWGECNNVALGGRIVCNDHKGKEKLLISVLPRSPK